MGQRCTLTDESPLPTAVTYAPNIEYLLILNSLDLRAGEGRMIEHALALTNNNRTKAAKLLGINLRTLRRKLNGKAKAPRRDPSQLALV